MNSEYIFAHLTIIVLVAAASGFLLAKLKQPTMVGYILAGVIFGPSCYSYISSYDQIQFYSELGIVLMLFVIGMELNIKSFMQMWRIPTFFTIIQVLCNVVFAWVFSFFFDFSLTVSLLAAFIASLSSTAAVVKVLEYIGELKTDVGHITIGILVAQDIVVVPMMLFMRQTSSSFDIDVLLKVIVAVVLVVLIIKHIGQSRNVKIPTNFFIADDPDLIPVMTLSACLLSSSLVVLFGLSEAYGAFLAGVYIGNTVDRTQVLNSIKPIQNVLLMSFFISVGLMFDLTFLVNNFLVTVAALAAITLWKFITNTIILHFFQIETSKAASIGIILAQLGEFSLVLANVAANSGIIGTYGQKLIICVTAMSLSISPFFIALSKRTRNLYSVGDNTVSSILKVLISKKFADDVDKLSVESIKIDHTK